MNQKPLQPDLSTLHPWDCYSNDLANDLRQWQDEGKDMTVLAPVFTAVAALPAGVEKARLADELFEMARNAPQRADFGYDEPSDWAAIQAACGPAPALPPVDPAALPDKIHGAWLGRVCGCLLGKPVEGMESREMIPFLKECGNYPLSRYMLAADADDTIYSHYRFPLKGRCFADTLPGAAVPDDDTNYTAMAQWMVERYGRDFTPVQVGITWNACQPIVAYCTAERVAWRNLINGFQPPVSAQYHNPYREWIGAQIRADYYGYINPGDPVAAAEMAWRDACISHTKNGIYGALFVAAMLAAAAVTDNVETVLQAGLSQVPPASRLHEAITRTRQAVANGVSAEDFFAALREEYPQHLECNWVHTIPNAMIVTAALLYGEGDFGKSICLAVQAGFDTDCNGATVGSLLGMMKGKAAIGPEWADPVNDTLQTTVTGVGDLSIAAAARKTLTHLPEKYKQ